MRRSEFHAEGFTRKREPLLRSIVEGLRYARGTKTVAIVLLMLLVNSTLAINFNVLLPILARQTLHGGPETYGLIASVFGLGAFIGALISASRGRASRRLLLRASAGFGVAQLFLATQHTLIPVIGGLLACGICYTIYTSFTNATVQLATPGFLQGRVGGLYNYVFIATGPVGSLLAGWFCQVSGTALAFGVGGVVVVGMALFGLLTAPWPMPTRSKSRRLRRT
jgi:MFS family permease